METFLDFKVSKVNYLSLTKLWQVAVKDTSSSLFIVVKLLLPLQTAADLLPLQKIKEHDPYSSFCNFSS
ncbi:MAG: hypothetical protein JWP45_291 [Mucilaginibacter sp.]|nr:hypothetical protein [Mucilaginibacter sp.]